MSSRTFRRGVIALAATVSLALPAVVAAQNPPPVPPPTPPVVTTPTQQTAAQAAAQAATGKAVTNDQISAAIRNSGLSQDQIQSRLKAAGYDPSLANPFFVAGTPGAQPSAGAPAGAQMGAAPGAAAGSSSEFAKALQALGILSEQPAGEKPIEKEARKPEEEQANREQGAARSGGIFGKAVFSGIGSAFDPVTSGPVDPSYRLGVGDQLQVVVTGQVELGFNQDIRRDGTIIVPQVGQIEVAGLTLEGARTLLKTRMARSYSGLASGEAQLDLTISRIRSNSVFVIGDVEVPGSYQVNALSTVFHALARAGGPSTRGSFRRVEVRRGGTLLRTIDLYDYLLRGDASNDIRTEQGDIIFVPLNTRAVAITGAVRRPAIFELKPQESAGDLIDFAGGLTSTAALDRVQIDRVLPPERRLPGFERVKLDVQLNGSIDSLRAVALHDADIVSVFAIGELRRNTVTVAGAVFQPGQYEFTKGMTLDTLVKRADGPLPFALTDRVKVRRLIIATGRSESFSFNLADSSARAFAMAEFDEVLLLDGRMAYPSGTISVAGSVRLPFTGPFVEHARLVDVIDLANGFTEFALVDRIKVERPIFETGRSQLFSVDFRTDSGRLFAMERGDHVTVLDARTAFPARIVGVSGAVVSEGDHPYVLNETLKDAIDRAGGFREEAASVTVARRRTGAAYSDTTSVLFSFPLDPRGRLDSVATRFVVEPDDRIQVRGSPGFRAQRFASLDGEFTHPGAYAVTENQDRLSDLVNRSGGLLPSAYSESFRLTRGGRVVAIDFARAMHGDRVHNVLLRTGDVLSIGSNPRTVFVTGAVFRPALIVFRPGLSVLDYVELAGGPTEKGNSKKAIVDFPAGYSERVRTFLHVVYSQPDIVSGATITVPENPPSTTSASDVWTRVLSSATALASIAIAYVAVRR